MTTIDEAKRCPRCRNAGQETSASKGPKGETVIVYTCRTAGCRWEGTGWVVQVNADGSIPERKPGPKMFEPMNKYQQAAAKRWLEQIKEEESRPTGPGTV